MTGWKKISIVLPCVIWTAFIFFNAGCTESGTSQDNVEEKAETAPPQELTPSCCDGKNAGAGKEKKLIRSQEKYAIPEATLVDHHGELVNFASLLDADKPVFLNFFFATCTTICPVLTAGFASFQDELGEKAGNVQLLSVTIDPEHDTSEVLREFSERFDAKEGWRFLTGSRKDIDTVMKAFDAYVVNKMNHLPLTFIHAPGKEEWIRVEGFLNTAGHVNEYRALATP